jgi:hypothetical protein
MWMLQCFWITKSWKLLSILDPFFENKFVGYYDGYDIVLERVPVNEDLCYKRRLCYLGFNFVWNNILSLWKLEDILFTINNFQTSSLSELTYISCVNPTFAVDSRLCNLRLSVVPLETVVASVAHLTSRSWSPLMVSIFRSIVHFRNINEFYIKRGHRSANMATFWVNRPGNRSWSNALSLAVAFMYSNAEGNFKEI